MCVWYVEVTNASGIKQQILVKQHNSSHCSALKLKLLSDDEFIEELSCVHLISIYHFLTLKLEYMRLLLLRNEDTSRVPSQVRRAPDSVTLGWKPSAFNRSISLPPGPTSWEKLWGRALNACWWKGLSCSVCVPLPSPCWYVGKYERVLMTAFLLSRSISSNNSVFLSCTYTRSQVKEREVYWKRKG